MNDLQQETMHSRQNGVSITAPQFLFVFGAAGSGNTFMFSCITQDANVYGVNEDAFGSTLERLLQSEHEVGKCPHSLKTFLDFLFALRKDRRTLVLKTPSNLRRIELLRKHIPNPRFIYMLREPHAAIVSGLSRHKQSVEEVAKIWQSDCKLLLDHQADDLTVVGYEQLARDPGAVIDRLAETVLPLSTDVAVYASRMHRPERSDDAWWKAKVSGDVQREIERWVDELALVDLHRQAGGEQTTVANGAVRSPGLLMRPLLRAKKEFFRGWYKVFK